MAKCKKMFFGEKHRFSPKQYNNEPSCLLSLPLPLPSIPFKKLRYSLSSLYHVLKLGLDSSNFLLSKIANFKLFPFDLYTDENQFSHGWKYNFQTAIAAKRWIGTEFPLARGWTLVPRILGPSLGPIGRVTGRKSKIFPISLCWNCNACGWPWIPRTLCPSLGPIGRGRWRT